MKCPKCGDEHTKVTQTEKRGTGVWRRRKCVECSHNFQSFEDLYIPKQRTQRPPVLPKLHSDKVQPAMPKKDKELIKKIKTEIRHKNEDRRNQVADYYIEDDFDDSY